MVLDLDRKSFLTPASPPGWYVSNIPRGLPLKEEIRAEFAPYIPAMVGRTNSRNMTDYGPKRISTIAPHMSAFGGKADIRLPQITAIIGRENPDRKSRNAGRGKPRLQVQSGKPRLLSIFRVGHCLAGLPLQLFIPRQPLLSLTIFSFLIFFASVGMTKRLSMAARGYDAKWPGRMVSCITSKWWITSWAC